MRWKESKAWRAKYIQGRSFSNNQFKHLVLVSTYPENPFILTPAMYYIDTTDRLHLEISIQIRQTGSISRQMETCTASVQCCLVPFEERVHVVTRTTTKMNRISPWSYRNRRHFHKWQKPLTHSVAHRSYIKLILKFRRKCPKVEVRIIVNEKATFYTRPNVDIIMLIENDCI